MLWDHTTRGYKPGRYEILKILTKLILENAQCTQIVLFLKHLVNKFSYKNGDFRSNLKAALRN